MLGDNIIITWKILMYFDIDIKHIDCSLKSEDYYCDFYFLKGQTLEVTGEHYLSLDIGAISGAYQLIPTSQWASR